MSLNPLNRFPHFVRVYAPRLKVLQVALKESPSILDFKTNASLLTGVFRLK